MQCIYCGDEIRQKRADLGYDYCMKPRCAVTPLSERGKNYRLVLLPKQGFTYVLNDSKDLRDNGKSSGR